MLEDFIMEKYKRILLKLSGEAISGGDKGIIDFDLVKNICKGLPLFLTHGDITPHSANYFMFA